MENTLPLLVITGPTASGKTKKSIELAKLYSAEIICADSRIIYKGFDIASAKPSPQEQDGIVHHLIDILEPVESFSAGDFVELARKKIKDIRSSGKNVIICGGTWFYIKSLLDEEDLPKIGRNDELRKELEKSTPQELWDILNELDPKRAQVVHMNNKDKVIRSIEMCKHLGSPISQYKRGKNAAASALWFAPEVEREELYRRIEERVDLMMDSGLKEEFDALIKKYGPNKIISNTIGYREFLENDPTADAVNKIKQHTRNYAKRQLSWLRGNPAINFVDFETHSFENVKVM